MGQPKHDPPDTLVEVVLTDDEIAQIDALIEARSTPSHRVTREEVLGILLEQGRKLAEEGVSLVPFLEPPSVDDAPDKVKH
jgi:hypothetical protein